MDTEKHMETPRRNDYYVFGNKSTGKEVSTVIIRSNDGQGETLMKTRKKFFFLNCTQLSNTDPQKCRNTVKRSYVALPGLKNTL